MEKIKKKLKKQYKHSWLARRWRRYEYKHTTMSILSVIAFVFILDTALVQAVIHYIQHLGLWGVFIAGILYTSFFTAAPAIALIIALSGDYNPLLVGLIGGLGSVVGDLIILKIFEEKIGYELKPLAKKFHLKGFLRRIKRRKERERSLLFGMFVLASPLPDELGIALMGLSKFNVVYLMLIAYIMNCIGVMIVAAAQF